MILQWKIFPTQILFILLNLKGSVTGAGIIPLNVKKTKEMPIDFRIARTVIPDLFIDGVKVERVTEFKYLGTVLDNKLNLNKNTDFIHKIIFCLQMLRSLNVSAPVLCTFYQSCIESV